VWSSWKRKQEFLGDAVSRKSPRTAQLSQPSLARRVSMIFQDEVALIINDIQLAQIEIRAITPRSFNASKSGSFRLMRAISAPIRARAFRAGRVRVNAKSELMMSRRDTRINHG
jgi:hypothetical protein